MNPLDALPDFETLTYNRIKPPVNAKLLAWRKAAECERRLVFYAWVENNNDKATPAHLVLLNDALSGFLLSFEAALQHAKDQYEAAGKKPPFDQWLATLPENDPLLKGIRTLRHLDAHVEHYEVAGHITIIVGPAVTSQRRWSLQELSATDLARLKNAQLKQNDLPDWNALVQSSTAVGLIEGGLDRLQGILAKLEALI